jgi:lysophospholipase L1-like esterase
MHPEIETYNKSQSANDSLICKQLCAELEITYIAVFSELTDDKGYLDEKYSNDKLHLMGNAYLVWKEEINPYVRESVNPVHH